MAKAKTEKRGSIEDPQTPITWSRLTEIIGMDAMSATGITVTTQSALGIPAVWAAVQFISGTIAGLPLHTYRKSRGSRKQINTRISRLLHDNVNEEMSSFAWRKAVFEKILTRGRSYTLIVRGEREPIRYLWPLENDHVVPKIDDSGRRVYEVKKGPHAGKYRAQDVIDMYFALGDNGVDHYSPLLTNKDTIGLAIAATQWGSRFFQNGGVPPFAITGKFNTGGALRRASDDLQEAIRQGASKDRLALSLPEGHELTMLGSDPSKMQLVALKKFLIEEIARIYSLPPVFLQDLSHGTFSNTEQQDLHFVKHTVKRWVEQFEQELNLKLFGWEDNSRFVEFNLDGLLRGDFKTRMDGYGQGIQNAVLTPNEVRRRENLPDMENGDDLLIQGATVPLGQQPVADNQGEESDED